MALLPEAILTNKIRFSAHPQVYLLTIFKAVTPVAHPSGSPYLILAHHLGHTVSVGKVNIPAWCTSLKTRVRQ